jgi:cytochrome P450
MVRIWRGRRRGNTHLDNRIGPIVRINPGELHINDHDFNLTYFNGKKLDKGEWYYQLASKATAGIHSHIEHKKRRALLSPLFNGEKLKQFSSSIEDVICKFAARLNVSAKSSELVDATHLLWALMNDVMTQYVLGADLDYVNAADLSVAANMRSFSALRLASFFRQWPMPLFFKLRHLPVIRSLSPLTSIETVGSKFL